jgi:hypothetical protein
MTAGTCPCGTPVLYAFDVDTEETLVVDAQPLDVATIEVFRAGTALACRRRGTPGRAPVHAEHDCTYAQDQRRAQRQHAVAIAHLPTDPGVEQAGWRAP